MTFNNITVPVGGAETDEIEAKDSSSLSSVAIGARVIVMSLDFESDVSAWLEAVGLVPGEEITVIRRAIFGGPLHVRTSSDGEFAVAPDLAMKIRVRAP